MYFKALTQPFTDPPLCVLRKVSDTGCPKSSTPLQKLTFERQSYHTCFGTCYSDDLKVVVHFRPHPEVAVVGS